VPLIVHVYQYVSGEGHGLVKENLRVYGIRHDRKLDESSVLQREVYTLSLFTECNPDVSRRVNAVSSKALPPKKKNRLFEDCVCSCHQDGDGSRNICLFVI
jgi:hypothetical protein